MVMRHILTCESYIVFERHSHLTALGIMALFVLLVNQRPFEMDILATKTI